MRHLLILAALAAVFGCKEETESLQLNGVGDCLRVEVRPGDEGDDDSAAGDDDSAAPASECDVVSTIDLVPLAGLFDIGTIGRASVTPTRFPAHTTVTVAVELVDTASAQGNPVEAVDRATVAVNNGTIDLNTFELEESPGDERRWFIQLQTGGVPESTARCDALCIALWAPADE